MNRALDVAAAGAGLVLAGPVLAAAAVAITRRPSRAVSFFPSSRLRAR